MYGKAEIKFFGLSIKHKKFAHFFIFKIVKTFTLNSIQNDKVSSRLTI